MFRAISLFVAVVGILIAVMAALQSDSRNVVLGSQVGVGRGTHIPRYVNANAPNRCLSDPVECGLVVW